MGQESNSYFLLDSENNPLARSVLMGGADGEVLQIRVMDDKIEDVVAHEQIRMVSLSDGGPALLGRIVRFRNDVVILERLEILEKDMRQNLRMPIRFNTFIYPLSGRWKGRRVVVSKDLSCGGIAFFFEEKLEVGEELEIVIPITSQPVILRCELLRVRSGEGEIPALYAAKFVDLCHDEEMIVREAVFSVQLQNRPRHSA